MKKIAAFFAMVFLAVGMFAQSAPSTGLTDKDVKNFIKNYPAFLKEVEKLDAVDDYSDLAALAAYGDIERILDKIGLSGNNKAEKFQMIGACAALIAAEQEMDAETLAMFKAFGLEDPLAFLKEQVNDKDYKVVKSNYAELAKLLDLIESE